MNTTPVLDWHGCYREGWKGLIGDDSFTHPAKFAPGLVRRIFSHGLERGYWRAGGFVQVNNTTRNIILAEIASGDYIRQGDTIAGKTQWTFRDPSNRANAAAQTQSSERDLSRSINSPSDPSPSDNIAATARERGSKPESQTNGLPGLFGCGASTPDQYPKASLCTTSTKTPPTTVSKISHSSSGPPTQRCTSKDSATPNKASGSNTRLSSVRDAAQHTQPSTNDPTADAIVVGRSSAEKQSVVTKSGYAVDLRNPPSVGDWVYQRPSVLADPFGGIGGGGVVAAGMGLRWRGVELEPRFVEMARANFGMHQAAWIACGCPLPDITQGDSRRFAEIVAGCAGVACSPPFGERRDGQGIAATGETTSGRALGRSTLANGVVTSPPYAETLSHGGGPDTKQDLLQVGPSLQAIKAGYGEAPGQIGALKEGDIDGVVTSPPYADSATTAGNSGNAMKAKTWGTGKRLATETANYGSAPGQIGKLREGAVDGCVTSPPWEADAVGTLRGEKFKDPAAFAAKAAANGSMGKNNRHPASAQAIRAQMERDKAKTYGDSDGQLGNDAGETYWQAMHQVYAQVHRAIVPGGVLCVVVKDFIRGGQRVPLCDRTMTLLESLGFIPIERARAWLVSETRETGLMGEIVTTRSRKSFFRRLAEKKGSPAIDWEEVLFVRTGTEAKTP